VTFSYGFDNENIKKKCHSHVRTILLGIIFTQWRHPVASREALDLLYWAMRAFRHGHIAMAIELASFVGNLLIVVCMPVALAAAGAIRIK
jgi:hypothetical protein